MKLDFVKIENLLIKNWSEIIDVREICKFLQQDLKTISKATITRFEFVSDGFIIWFEYTKSNINHCVEIESDKQGNLKITDQLY